MSMLASRRFALAGALRRLARRPWATLGALALSSSAIALVLTVATLVLALQPTWQRLGAATQAVVFMSLSASPNDVAAVTATALAQPGVMSATHVARDTALAGLSRLAPGAALPELKVNPLPDAVVVRFALRTDVAQAQALVASLRKAARVDAVQFDVDRHRRWHAAVTVLMLVGAALGCLILFIACGVVFLMPRGLGLIDQDEVAVLHLAGATAGFAARPAAYAGALLGSASALLAIALVAGAWAAAAPQLEELRIAWASDSAWSLPATAALATLTLCATLLGWLGGRLASTSEAKAVRGD